jgi:hypothetical protein
VILLDLAEWVFLPVSDLLSSNMMVPTYFLAPSLPSVLLLHIQASRAIAFTTMAFTLGIPARSSREGIATRSQSRTPVMLLATLLKATWIGQQVDVTFVPSPSVGNLGVATAASPWERSPRRARLPAGGGTFPVEGGLPASQRLTPAASQP